MNGKRQLAEIRGRRGEAVAAWWLRLQGWQIVGQRMRTARGEVDLIARRGKTLAFVEVKARHTYRDLSLAIDQARLRRVAAAADMLFPRFAKGAENVRIDVILIAPWRLPRHLVNVWHG
jgi:putative endonuclease